MGVGVGVGVGDFGISTTGDPAAEAPLVVRLFGPGLDEVAAFVRPLGTAVDPALAWEAFPEVHVRCPGLGVARALLERYGAAVYAIGGLPFEAAVGGALVAAGWTLATAESCTGGLIGHLVTNVPGSSNYYRLGVVAYSNEAKVRLLGVPEDLIARHGAVSEPVVRAMAEGVRSLGGADVAVSVSGVAGPGGGTPQKPVGTVWMAVAGPRGTRAVLRRLEGDRGRIKRAAAWHALDLARRVALGEDVS